MMFMVINIVTTITTEVITISDSFGSFRRASIGHVELQQVPFLPLNVHPSLTKADILVH